MIATGGAPTLSSSSLKTRPICGESPMILKKFRVTDAVETRSASRPGMPLRLRDSLCVQARRSEEHTSELQSRRDIVCRLLLEKKNKGSQPSANSALTPATSTDSVD